MKKIFLFIFLLTISFANSYSATIEMAKDLIKTKKYNQANTVLLELHKKSPKSVPVIQLLGESYYYINNYKEAIKYLSLSNTKSADDLFYLAASNYFLGNYTKANQSIENYLAFLKKWKKSNPVENKKLITNIQTAYSLLDHVEKIVIIDSLVVPKTNFFSYYKLAKEVGELKDISILNDKNAVAPVYLSETKEKMIWSSSKNKNNLDLYQSTKLIDGSWDEPHLVDSKLSMGGNAMYPYMMPDGASLYFASDGNNSIGGLDIFVAGKDLDSGDYYNPQNIGMPYNSPYDDYMYIIDEESGFGWWATDRNRIEDKVTIYIFKSNAIRTNYDDSNANIDALAFVKSIKETWEGADYDALRNKISKIEATKGSGKTDFQFVINNSTVYHNYSEFKTNEAKSLMKELLVYQSDLDNKQLKLKKERSLFYNNKSNQATIMSYEKEILLLNKKISNIGNSIRKYELSK